MKNIKKIILINEDFSSTTVEKIREVADKEILLIAPLDNKKMFGVLESLISGFGIENVSVTLSKDVDIETKHITSKYTGFEIIKKVEGEGKTKTIILIGSNAFVNGILFYLQIGIKIGIPLMDIEILKGQVLLIDNGEEKEVRFI